MHLFPNMTILENAMVGQHCRTRSGVLGSVLRLPATRREEERIRARARESLAFFGSRLAGYREEQPAFALSYANRRRLEMARALATDPLLVMLDEPTAGMNPRETLELRDHIVRMRDELGLTVLVIEHDMRVVKGVSDRVDRPRLRAQDRRGLLRRGGERPAGDRGLPRDQGGRMSDDDDAEDPTAVDPAETGVDVQPVDTAALPTPAEPAPERRRRPQARSSSSAT